MAKLNTQWIVQPHGDLQALAPGILTVASGGMARIEQEGPVRFLIVPNRGHRLDLNLWKARYPAAQVIART